VNAKKFDVRYRLIVRSWEPLEVFRWVHWGLRVSNHEYSLKAEDIDDFEVGVLGEGEGGGWGGGGLLFVRVRMGWGRRGEKG